MQLKNESPNLLRQTGILDFRFSGVNMNFFRQMGAVGQTFPKSSVDLLHILERFSPLFLPDGIPIHVQCQWASVKPSTETDLSPDKKRLFLHV